MTLIKQELASLKNLLRFDGARLPVQPQQPGFIEGLLDNALTEAFTTTRSDGSKITTYQGATATEPTPAQSVLSAQEVTLIARHQQAERTAGASAPEASLEKAGNLFSSLLIYAWAPVANWANKVAIDRDMIPTPDGLLGKELVTLSASATKYTQLPRTITQNPEAIAIISEIANQALLSAETALSLDMSSSELSTPERTLAHQAVKTIANSMIEQRNGLNCPYCGQFVCKCGYSKGVTQPEVQAHIQEVSHQYNQQLALSTTLTEFTLGQQELAATDIKKVLKKNQDITLLHIPWQNMLVAAFLSDWKEIGPALGSAIIPNEVGLRGASITLHQQTDEFGGNKLIVSRGKIGKGSDSQELPINAITGWIQPDWQQVISDNKGAINRWKKTKHRTIPETGKLIIASPGDQAIRASFPMTVRYDADNKPSTGGAAIKPIAIKAFQDIQAYLVTMNTKSQQSRRPSPQTEEELKRQSKKLAEDAIRNHGVRPGKVNEQVIDMYTRIQERQYPSETLRQLGQYSAQKLDLQKAKKQAEKLHQQKIAQLSLAVKEIEQLNIARQASIHFRQLGSPNMLATDPTTGRYLSLAEVKLYERKGKEIHILDRQEKEIKTTLDKTIATIKELAPALIVTNGNNSFIRPTKLKQAYALAQQLSPDPAPAPILTAKRSRLNTFFWGEDRAYNMALKKQAKELARQQS